MKRNLGGFGNCLHQAKVRQSPGTAAGRWKARAELPSLRQHLYWSGETGGKPSEQISSDPGGPIEIDSSQR